MQSVLIVEDSPMVLKILKHIALKVLDFNVEFAQSRAEAIDKIENGKNWLAAVVDLNLPDAPDGELVLDCLKLGLPTIVLTGSVNQERRDKLSKLGVVDYVLKEGRFSYIYAINLVNRLYRNQSIKVLVAEDSKLSRCFMVGMLKRHLFQVVEAEDGQQALDIILADPSIRVLITDNNMPNMDGFDLIHNLRHKYDNYDLMAIGLSSAEDKYLSAKFIKNGANDFLYKPFSNEEFFCRVMQTVDAMERLDEMREMAYTDPLTKLGNRRYFVENMRREMEAAKKDGSALSFAIVDIDYFKHVNDQYGHDVGDQILEYIGKELQENFVQFIVARMGGEEFSVLFPGLDKQRAHQLLDAFREHIEDSLVDTNAGKIRFTFSAGIADSPNDAMELMMKAADEALYRAKEDGRNVVMLSE